MTTVSKAKKTTETKAVAKPAATDWRPIDPFLCEFPASNGDMIRGKAIQSNGKMHEITYVEGGKERQIRVPIAKVKAIGSLELVPTEFTEHDPIAAVYRKGKKEIDCFIVATRNDGALYRIQGEGIPPATVLPIEKVMIIAPEPTAPPEEPAAEPQQTPAARPAATWVRQAVPVELIKGSAESKAQISTRYNNETERDYTYQMLMGLWDWERPGSEPRLFWDGTEFHTGDGHHTAQALTIAHEWVELAEEFGEPTAATPAALLERWENKLIELPTEIPCYVAQGTARDAKRYSLRIANRFNGMRLTNEQKRSAVTDLITDLAMLEDVTRDICIATGKDFGKYSDAIPSDRAISDYLGNISAPTVAEVWAEAIAKDATLDEPLWPWLNATSRMGLDGKLQKVKAKDEPKPKAPPQVKEVPPEVEVIDQADAVDRTGNSVNTPTSTPAPTDNAPVKPGKTYSGEERFIRIKELAEKHALEIIHTIAGEMKVKATAEEAYEWLVDAISEETKAYVLGAAD